MIRSATNRSGYTLLELMAVLAAIIILGVIILPTLSGLRANTQLTATSDLFRSMMADARGHAIESGRNYALLLSADGTQLSVEVDTFNPNANQAQNADAGLHSRLESFPKGVTAAILIDDAPVANATNWQRVATLQPDGTCREDNVFVQLSEEGSKPMVLQIRGLTGGVTVLNTQQQSSNGGQP